MKLIEIEADGGVEIINPLHVKTVKGVESDINKDWCIVINLANETPRTILCDTHEKYAKALKDVKECLESINK